MQRILIIGNGFDIAHELPTRYSDFLDFLERFYAIYNSPFTGNSEQEAIDYQEKYIDTWEGNRYIKENLVTLFRGRESNRNSNLTQEQEGVRTFF